MVELLLLLFTERKKNEKFLIEEKVKKIKINLFAMWKWNNKYSID